MTPVFLHGALLDPELRRIVLGAEPAVRSAVLPDHVTAVQSVEGIPTLRPQRGARTEGVLVDAWPDPGARARLDAFLSVHGQAPAVLSVETENGTERAEVHLAPAERRDLGQVVDQAEWLARRHALAAAVASEIMALLPVRPEAEIAGRLRQIAVRAQARLNARSVAPTTLRRQARPDDVRVSAFRQPYGAYFAIEEYDLDHLRFDGGRSDVVTRAVFISGDAVAVLPYDPRRDVVLLVEQFRAGPFARGDGQPWSLEAIAGRIDPGESPPEAAHRETSEETGVSLSELIPLGGYYPSPGAKAEFLYVFLELADLPDDTAGLGGAQDEGEDIRAHVIGFRHLMDLLDSGEVENGPLVVTALQLARRRDALRERAGER